MSSAVNPLSYLYTSAYQNTAILFGNSSAAASTTAPTTGVSPTGELQAMETSGAFASFLNNSIAVATMEPATGVNSGMSAATLVNNLLQQVLGAYSTPTASQPTNST